MKRILSFGLAVVLAFSLAACGAKTEEGLTWQEQYDIGVRYLSEGNYEEAIIAFTAAIEIEPKRAEAYIGLADAYIGAGDIEKAEQVLNDALDNAEDISAIQDKLDGLTAEEPGETTWSFDNGVLTISGTGRMYDYNNYWERPWDNINNEITEVVIEEGVTTIGDYAFEHCFSLTSITIPSSVTSIGALAFYYCESLTSVTIPSSVTSIGRGAFYACDSLTSITIPSSVTSIGALAFYYCESLTSITIPSSVTSIGQGAFSACANLQTIEVNADNPNYCAADGVMFNKEMTELICFAAGQGKENYTIPSSVTSIGAHAFELCRSLTGITIPASVTSIGALAFYYCEGLTSITIPSSVTSIGDAAFYDCCSLTSIIIPLSVTSMGDGAFMCYDSSLTDIYYTGSETEWNAIKAGGEATNVVGNAVPEGVTIHYNYKGE